MDKQYLKISIGEDSFEIDANLAKYLLPFLECLDKTFSDLKEIYIRLNKMLEYLNTPEGNTSENCEIVSYIFTYYNYDEKIEKMYLPEELKNIIEDLVSLHDAHRHKDIALMLGSTPAQLLERLRKVEKKIENL